MDTRRWLKWASAALLLMLIFDAATMTRGTRDLWALMFERWRTEGAFGVGYWDGNRNQVDFSKLEPGDIILGGNTGSSWGYWTHATLYLGDGQVMETFLQTGVALDTVTRYNDYYSHAAALRVKAPKAVKEQAVEEAKKLLGKPFYLLGSRGSSSLFYCTKIVWYAYKRASAAAGLDIDLDTSNAYWVVPDRIAQSPWVEALPPEGRTANAQPLR
jgi:uncharacterized protein YycO